MQELTDIAEAIKRHEGCNIYGWLQVWSCTCVVLHMGSLHAHAHGR